MPGARWAVGCIFGELLKHGVLLPGKTEIKQLEKIVKFLGFPNIQEIGELINLPHVRAMNFLRFEGQPSAVTEFLQRAGISSEVRTSTCSTSHFFGFIILEYSLQAESILRALLAFDPRRRIGAEEALTHSYFDVRFHRIYFFLVSLVLSSKVALLHRRVHQELKAQI